MPRIPSSTLSRLSREFLASGELITAAMLDASVLLPYATKTSVAALASQFAALSSGLSAVAGSGLYSDLVGAPSIPSSPGDVGAATAAQGSLAEEAHGWGDHALAGYVSGDVLRPVDPAVGTTTEISFVTADVPAKTVTIQVSADGRVLKFGVV